MLAGPAGTPGAMEIIVPAARQVEVDHPLHARDVEPARRHVGCDQDVDTPAVEQPDDAITLALLELAVEHGGALSFAHQIVAERRCAVAGVGEDQRLLVDLVAEQPKDLLLLVLRPVAQEDLIRDVRVLLAHRIDGQHARLAQQTLGDAAQTPMV